MEVEGGVVRGESVTVSSDLRPVRVWRSIPYALPPVGALRFRPPQPVEPWSGVRDCSRFGPAPMQWRGDPGEELIPGVEVDEVSEDCLYLNVWAPEGDGVERGAQPVLIWVPGGGYQTGGPGVPTYDGARLCAEQDLVVVSVAYRLGVFGFLWLEGEVANCGLLDQLAAMGWVRRNVVAFGGDPTRMAAYGESAGAGSLLHLLASERRSELPGRVIVSSPGVDHTLIPDRAAVATAAVRARLGENLRDVPAAVLLQAQNACLAELVGSLGVMPFHPVVDGDLLLSKPSAALAGGAGSEVDVLLTWTADELRLYPNLRADDVGRDGLVRWTARYLASRLGADVPAGRAEALVDFYIAREAGAGRTRGSDVWAALQTDGSMRLPARRLAELRLGGPGATYCAEFAWASSGRGAFHAIDLPFVFGTLDCCGWRSFLGAGDDADKLSAEMRAAWGAFARTGVPAGPTTGSWSRYSDPDRLVTALDSPCSVARDPLGEVDRLWDGLWSIDGHG